MFIVKTLGNLDNFLITSRLLHFHKTVILWLDFMLKEEKSVAGIYAAGSCSLRVPLAHFLDSGPKFPPFVRETNTYLTGTL